MVFCWSQLETVSIIGDHRVLDASLVVLELPGAQSHRIGVLDVDWGL